MLSHNLPHLFDFAIESKLFAIGVDSDQDGEAPGFVLTSMMKRVDNAIFNTIKDLHEGKWSAGTIVYDLKSEGVGLSPMTYTKDKIRSETLEQVDALKSKNIPGEVKVPSKKVDLEDYLKTLTK